MMAASSFFYLLFHLDNPTPQSIGWGRCFPDCLWKHPHRCTRNALSITQASLNPMKLIIKVNQHTSPMHPVDLVSTPYISKAWTGYVLCLKKLRSKTSEMMETGL
jgi:hypothetical protein